VKLSTERLARNQALFREVNERLNEIHSPTVSFREFICECSDPRCPKSLAVAAGEYEAVRSNPKRFLVARGHELPEVEIVVEDCERFLIVETTVETGLMAESDPRSPDAGGPPS
jgi:hypothetical protein